ncbi:MAG TPA: hypothetical protein VGX46_02440, partial [Vicinamibacterales bacterium]|nr:hypothetical protein [Vicinamibacterales bacterium]
AELLLDLADGQLHGFGAFALLSLVDSLYASVISFNRHAVDLLRGCAILETYRAKVNGKIVKVSPEDTGHQ